MESCDQEKYEGLDAHLSSIVSCHKCKDPTRIPFVSVNLDKLEDDKITSISHYTLENVSANEFYSKGVTGFSTDCLEPINTTFNIDANKFNFPDNCAIGVIKANSVPDSTDSNKSVNVDRTKISTFCGSCKPGYSRTPAMDGNNRPVSYMTSNCALITNCETSTWMNYCS